jgi:hypothetical protein
MFKTFSTAHIALARVGLCVLSLAATPAAAAAAATAPFDGSWSVRIVTEKGTCDSGATVPIRVTNGSIASDLSVVKVSGEVASNGSLSVNVGHGLEHADGVGRLTDTSGSGTWKGGLCSGTWSASKN